MLNYKKTNSVGILYACLICLTLIGTRYSIITGFTWGDVFSGLLFCILIFNLMFSQWKFDKISALTGVYILIITISSLLNQTYLNTHFINFYRIFVSGWIIYVVFNNGVKSETALKIFSYLFILYSIVFLVQSSDILEASMMDTDNFNYLDFGYGRNNWGFSNLLILIILTFILIKIKLPIGIKIGTGILFPFLIFNIYFSASRSALISLIIFAVFIRLWWKKPLTIKEIGSYIIIFLFVPFILSFFGNSVEYQFLEKRDTIFEEKIGRTGDEAFNHRFFELNIDPIQNFLDKTTGVEVLTGDGLTVTHGILSHVAISTGIFGLIYFIVYNSFLTYYYIKKKNIGYFVAFVILIMFLNDISTNARFIVGINNMIYMLILAFLNNYLSKK